jgi:hypothetical protein
MSHSVSIKTKFKNRKLLLETFEKLDWKVVENQKCTTYPSDPSRNVVHQYVALNPIPRGYDVGIDINSDGEATFTCDFFDSSIAKQLGQNLKNVKQNYSLSELKQFMTEEDLNYEVETLKSGELKVIASK